jgi:hypothetical protein
MAYTLIGGTAVGTVLILLFLPALYAAWFRIKPTAEGLHEGSTEAADMRTARGLEHASADALLPVATAKVLEVSRSL